MDIMMIVLLVVIFGGMMWWQSKNAKKQQKEREDFRANLQPGTEVITIGQIIGKVVEVDTQYEEIVLDSEGSKIRVAFNAISREYTRPAYVSDDEVDEYGNPLEPAEDEQAEDVVDTTVVEDGGEDQIPFDQAADQAENVAESAEDAEKAE